jgi:hypothetical protein
MAWIGRLLGGLFAGDATATAETKYRDLSDTHWAMKLSSASVEMTFFVWVEMASFGGALAA